MNRRGEQREEGPLYGKRLRVDADRLEQQVTHPVRWEACMRQLVEIGVDEVLEVGHGKTLATLAKKIDKELTVTRLGTPADFEAILPRIRGETWDGMCYRPDLKRFTRRWREEGWHQQSNGVQVRGDKLHLILPNGLEWHFDGPHAHGF